MNLRSPAVLLSSRAHGETGAVARLLTPDNGLVAAYVAGGRGRQMRAVMVPGNRVALDLAVRSASQLPFAKLELEHSRAALMTEPLPAAAIQWICALTAASLPERYSCLPLYEALDALLAAIAVAPSARGWVSGLVAYEAMLLAEMGYGAARPDPGADLPALLEALGQLEAPLANSLLAGRKRDVMAARKLLTDRLARMA